VDSAKKYWPVKSLSNSSASWLKHFSLLHLIWTFFEKKSNPVSGDLLLISLLLSCPSFYFYCPNHIICCAVDIEQVADPHKRAAREVFHVSKPPIMNDIFRERNGFITNSFSKIAAMTCYTITNQKWHCRIITTQVFEIRDLSI